MPVIKTCVICQVEFKVPPVRAETATTCSRACKGVMIRQRYEAEWLTKKCPACGDEYNHPAWQRARKFCSELCKANSESAAWAVAEKSEGGKVSLKSDGYVAEYRPRHPNASSGGWVQQHRLVMEEWMRECAPDHEFLVEVEGLKILMPDIEVHHRDECRSNNRRENLVACTRFGHRAMHHGNPVLEIDVWPLDGLIVKGMALCKTIK